MRMAARLQRMKHAKYRGTTRRSGKRDVWTGRINLDRTALEAPFKWIRPRRIFVNSMSDLFHEDIPTDYVRDVWSVMRDANWHHYQVLTKRPERMLVLLSRSDFEVLSNVWVGTSVENEEHAYRVDILRQVPARVRFLSIEPLLGPVGTLDLSSIHWVIVGGESGPRARPMHPDWVDEIHLQCRKQRVPFFFKQWGGKNKKAAGRHYRGRTWDEYPVELYSA
jgi:protein gp37